MERSSDSLLTIRGEEGFLTGLNGFTAILSNLSSETEHSVVAMRDRIRIILEQLSAWVNVELLSVLLYNGTKETLELIGLFGRGIPAEIPEETQKVGEHLTGKAFSDGTTIVCNEIKNHPDADKDMVDFWKGRLPSGDLKNAIFIPFSTEFECRGVFRAFNKLDEKRSPSVGFSRRDIYLLETLAQVVGFLVELVWERQHLARINNATSTLTTIADVKEIALETTKAATQIANTPCATLYFLGDSDPEHLYLAGYWGFSRPYKALTKFPVKSSISGRVATSGRTEIIPNLLTAEGVANRDIAREENLRTCVAVPAQSTSLKGCLAVFSRDTREFHRTTIRALENLGLFAASVVEVRRKTVQIDNLTIQLGMAGHSVRSPLQGIATMANEIRAIVNANEPPTEIPPLLHELFAELERADRRINSMLYSPPGSLSVLGLDISSVRLPRVLEACVARHTPNARSRGIKLIIYDSVRRLPPIRGDAEKLDLLFDNLLENAVKYSWANQSIEIRGEHNAAEVCVSVSDKGLGIPEEYFGDLFEGFWRSPILDQTRYIAGTGLGLRIVKIIADAHGGGVTVRSKPFLSDPIRTAKYEGYETTFTVALPINKGE